MQYPFEPNWGNTISTLRSKHNITESDTQIHYVSLIQSLILRKGYYVGDPAEKEVKEGEEDEKKRTCPVVIYGGCGLCLWLGAD